MKFLQFIAFFAFMVVVTAFPGKNKTEVKYPNDCPTTGWDMEAWESFMADLIHIDRSGSFDKTPFQDPL